MARLSFTEIRRALQALSTLYVQKRAGLTSGAALNGAGKRAAFALFYGPLHYLLVREVVRALREDRPPPSRIFDLGCGTGVAGAAWVAACGGRPLVEGIDRNPWAVEEARWTYRELGLDGRARCADLARVSFSRSAGALLAAFTVNELSPTVRERLLGRILAVRGGSTRVLIVEPISRRTSPWWSDWSAAFATAGGRDDSWRFDIVLPEPLRLLDRAAGLDHGGLTCRTLYLPGGP